MAAPYKASVCGHSFPRIAGSKPGGGMDAYLLWILFCVLGREARGGAVVKALRYKPVGRGFDSRWCHSNFSVT